MFKKKFYVDLAKAKCVIVKSYKWNCWKLCVDL